MRLKERNHIFWTSWREICKVSPCVGSTGPLLLKEKGYINMRPLFTMKYLNIKYSKLLKSFQKVIQYNTFSFSKLYLFEKIPLWKGTCLNSWGTIWVPFWTKKRYPFQTKCAILLSFVVQNGTFIYQKGSFLYTKKLCSINLLAILYWNSSYSEYLLHSKKQGFLLSFYLTIIRNISNYL